VTQLHEAGVRFQVSRSKNLFDIIFDKKKGILKIPSFILSAETELTIRNSLAFEQCHYSEKHINDYVIIMNRLVDTRKDIELLVKEGIVENRFSYTRELREGSNFLNKLADGAILDENNFYFASLSEELNAYYNTSWHKWKANLKQKYFITPWSDISLLAAVFLLILIQTVCSVISLAPLPTSK
jgi:hypothetical protein